MRVQFSKSVRPLIFVVALSYGTLAAADPIRYNVVDIGSSVPNSNSFATSISKSGIVAVHIENPGAPPAQYLYDHGQITPVASIYSINGVNDSGQVLADQPSFSPTAIDNYGRLAGEAGGHLMLSSSGTAIDLGTFGYQGWDHVSAMNDSGQIIGQGLIGNLTQGLQSHAFLYSNGKTLDLGNDTTYGYAINSQGDVVGLSNLGSTHPFLYHAGKVVDLGSLGGAYGWAYGINDSGQIVGSSFDTAGNKHAFLYENNKMLDLNALVPSNGLTQIGADGIDRNGDVIVEAIDSQQNHHALLLTPAAVPEPSSLALGIVALSLGFVRKHFKEQKSVSAKIGVSSF